MFRVGAEKVMREKKPTNPLRVTVAGRTEQVPQSCQSVRPKAWVEWLAMRCCFSAGLVTVRLWARISWGVSLGAKITAPTEGEKLR